MRDLEGAQQPLVKQLMRRQAGDVLAIHVTAGGRRKNARDHVEKRGLSRAVGADQPGDRARSRSQLAPSTA
jgi:hypothetical protein